MHTSNWIQQPRWGTPIHAKLNIVESVATISFVYFDGTWHNCKLITCVKCWALQDAKTSFELPFYKTDFVKWVFSEKYIVEK